MDKHQQLFAMRYLIIILVFLALSQSFFIAPHVQQLDYSEFKALLRAGNIVRVTLGTPYVQGELRTEGIERILPQDKVAMIVLPRQRSMSPA